MLFVQKSSFYYTLFLRFLKLLFKLTKMLITNKKWVCLEESTHFYA